MKETRGKRDYEIEKEREYEKERERISISMPKKYLEKPYRRLF